MWERLLSRFAITTTAVDIVSTLLDRVSTLSESAVIHSRILFRSAFDVDGLDVMVSSSETTGRFPFEDLAAGPIIAKGVSVSALVVSVSALVVFVFLSDISTVKNEWLGELEVERKNSME